MAQPPRDLRTEHRDAPLDVDALRPRFSWRPTDTGRRDARQSAWQIEAADDGGRLVWDSGSRPGAEVEAAYDGVPLRPFSRYRWRVRCWDEHGDVSGYAPWVPFETAALSPVDFRGTWITHPNPARYDEGSWESGVPKERTALEQSVHYLGIYCATSFSLNGRDLRRARALVCGVGAFCVYLDGRRVGEDILSPAPTDYRKRALYTVYDIGPFIDPDRGEHCIAVALGNGRHIALYGFGKPRAYVQVLLETEDGETRWVCSDGSWKVGEGPLRENSIFNGERFDARMPIPSGSADLEGAVDAEVVEGYPLRAAMLPPIRVDQRIAPVRRWRAGEGFVYDFGQNFSGAIELRLSVPRGTELRLRFAELIHADGTLNPSSNRAARSCDRYIASGVEGETWQPAMTYHGFRYAMLEGYPGVPGTDTVTGLFFHTAVRREGEFACSYPLFDQIHRNVVWGQLSNLMGIPTDSPQRDERHGWLGDAMLSAEECILNFGANGFYEKYLQDIVDTQSADGSITDVAPKFWMDKPADPAWGTALLSIAWLLYRYQGDRGPLERHYDAFRRYLGFLERSAEDFIIENLGTFGDWCAPGMVVPRKTDLSFTATWYFQHDAGTLANIADVLGDAGEAARCRTLRLRIVDAMNARFRRGDHYETTPLSPWDMPDQTSQAMALCSPLVPIEDRAAVAAALGRLVTSESGDHIGTGIHGAHYLLIALTDTGHAEKAFAVAAQESYPGWGYMIREGATTLWERWEKIETAGMNSHNHVMLASIDRWFYGAVAGLSIGEAGFREIVFSPGRLGKISWAHARIETPTGAAAISWKRAGEDIDLDIRIPPGCRGRLRLPAGFAVGSLESTPAGGDREPLAGCAPTAPSMDSGWYHARLTGT